MYFDRNISENKDGKKNWGQLLVLNSILKGNYLYIVNNCSAKILIWICWFLAKNMFKFVSLSLKLENPYYYIFNALHGLVSFLLSSFLAINTKQLKTIV